jgi:mitochondrial fission protein ELM1
MSRAIILSDGRMGHLNQSIALAKYLGFSYDIVEVKARYRWSKMLSYLFDRVGVVTTTLFDIELSQEQEYSLVIGAGSLTYYMVKVISKRLEIKSVVMMLPRGYRYNYDIIFAQMHDRPPLRDNIIPIPINFAYVEPQGIYSSNGKSIAIVIGGDNREFKLSLSKLKLQLDEIVKSYEGYEIAITTSPRTSKEIESLVASYDFNYRVIFSQNPINPIPDFLAQCESIFITGDSTSMISEALSYGSANVVVLPLEVKQESKFTHFISRLEAGGYLHIFDGTIKYYNKKIDFTSYLKGVRL